MDWLSALLGGILIGVSASLMLLWNGRVAGVSGIIFGILKKEKGDLSWRFSFLSGLVLGGCALTVVRPSAFSHVSLPADWTVIVAGLLVGFGTVLGSGCTSGHGVCGVSRLSRRSLVATSVFIASGVLTVLILRALGVML